MASITDTTKPSQGQGTLSASTCQEAIFNMEDEVRTARYLADALSALAENGLADRAALSYFADKLKQQTRLVEVNWERAFDLGRAH